MRKQPIDEPMDMDKVEVYEQKGMLNWTNWVREGRDYRDLIQNVVMFMFVSQDPTGPSAMVAMRLFGVDTTGEVSLGGDGEDETTPIALYRGQEVMKVPEEIQTGISMLHPAVAIAVNSINHGANKDRVAIKIWRLKAQPDGMIDATVTIAAMPKADLLRYNLPERFVRLLNHDTSVATIDAEENRVKQELLTETIQDEIKNALEKLVPEGGDYTDIPEAELHRVIGDTVKAIAGENTDFEVHAVRINPRTGEPERDEHGKIMATRVTAESASRSGDPDDPHVTRLGFSGKGDLGVN